jgi:acetyl esterase
MKHVLEKETDHFIKGLEAAKAPPIYTLPILQARKVLDDLQSTHVEKPIVHIDDRTVSYKNKKISIRIVRPPNTKERLPVIMYFHGGGWILGNKNTHDRLIRELATSVHAALVFVNYTPSPEAKHGQIIEEAFFATKYVAEHGKDLNLDTTHFAVAGDSVGGCIAAVICQMAKEQGPKIDFQLLFYPVTDANFNTGSYQEFANGPWLTKAAMQWFWNAYAPDVNERKNPSVSPLQATVKQLQHLPPALIITDDDVLRDEGEAYAFKLLEAGVEVASCRFLGTCHDFVMLNALRHTSAARSAMALATFHLQKALMVKKTEIHKAA